MLNLKQAIQDDIETGIKEAFGDLKKDIPVVVRIADDVEHGDYASPIALSLSKILKKKPLEIVEEIVKHMPKKEYLGRVTAAEPGFLNVRISPGWLTARLDNVLDQDVTAELTLGKGKSVNLEFISANPTGPLTIGNIRSAFPADTLGNVFQAVGYNVTREYYFNDAGQQIKKLGESILRRILQTGEYPEELYQGEYVKDVAQKVAEQFRENEGKEFSTKDLEDADLILRLGKAAATMLMAHIKDTIANVLKITFTSWVSEQQIRDSGAIDAVLEKLRKQGDAYDEDGAVWFKSTKYGDEKDKVLVKSNGEFAYIMPDLGYHENKFEREFDLIFTFVGADHLDQMKKVRQAMEVLGHDVSKLHFPINQWFRLIKDGKPVKLSKRRGNITTPEELIAEVGYDATRFFFLQHDLQSQMDFDLDLAKERSEKNPVYYVQYAYVRLQSILRRAKEEGVIKEVGEVMELTSHAELTHTAEIALMKQMYRLPEVLVDIAESFAVHQLAYYAHDLASAVHSFYKQVRVLGGDRGELIMHRLQLVLAARAVLGKTLDLLGISKPDVM